MTRRNQLKRKGFLFALTLLAAPLMGMEECGPLEGPGPIGELDGMPEVVFAPLTPSGEVVADVDLERYVGLWYEVLSDVPIFEVLCTAITAEYQPLSRGLMVHYLRAHRLHSKLAPNVRSRRPVRRATPINAARGGSGPSGATTSSTTGWGRGRRSG